MPKKKRNLGGFFKKLGMGGLAVVAELDPTGLVKKIGKQFPGLNEIISDDNLTDAQVQEEMMAKFPNIARDLRELELQEFKTRMQTLVELENADVAREKVHSEDRASARDMRIKTGDKFPNYLAAGTVVFAFVLVLLLLFYDIPEGNEQLLNIGFGAILGVLSTIFAFFFGSSSGSKRKTDSMTKIMNGGKPHHFIPGGK